jgi:hypothetical protein
VCRLGFEPRIECRSDAAQVFVEVLVVAEAHR